MEYGEALMYRQVKILLQDSEISLSAKFHPGFIPPSHGIKLTVWLYVRLFSVNVGLLISREGDRCPPAYQGGQRPCWSVEATPGCGCQPSSPGECHAVTGRSGCDPAPESSPPNCRLTSASPS